MAQQQGDQQDRQPSNLRSYILLGLALIYLFYGKFSSPPSPPEQSSIANNTLLNMYPDGHKLVLFNILFYQDYF